MKDFPCPPDCDEFGRGLSFNLFVRGGAIYKTELKVNDQPKLRICIENGNDSLAKQIDDWVEAYLAREPLPLSLPLCDAHLFPFTKKVLSLIKDIPFGETRSYSALAVSLGHPLASRAVGFACHQNPFPLLIPCHRVIAKRGLGGFAFPLSIKKLLLSFEIGTLFAPSLVSERGGCYERGSSKKAGLFRVY